MRTNSAIPPKGCTKVPKSVGTLSREGQGTEFSTPTAIGGRRRKSRKAQALKSLRSPPLISVTITGLLPTRRTAPEFDKEGVGPILALRISSRNLVKRLTHLISKRASLEGLKRKQDCSALFHHIAWCCLCLKINQVRAPLQG